MIMHTTAKITRIKIERNPPPGKSRIMQCLYGGSNEPKRIILSTPNHTQSYLRTSMKVKELENLKD